MKKLFTLSMVLVALVAFGGNAMAGIAVQKPAEGPTGSKARKALVQRDHEVVRPGINFETPTVTTAGPGDEAKSTTRAERKQMKKQMRETLREQKKSAKPNGGDVLVGVLLAIFLSPFAILYWEGATGRFWIDLICWLIGIGFVGFFYYSGLLLLFAIIFALLIVLGSI